MLGLLYFTVGANAAYVIWDLLSIFDLPLLLLMLIRERRCHQPSNNIHQQLPSTGTSLVFLFPSSTSQFREQKIRPRDMRTVIFLAKPKSKTGYKNKLAMIDNCIVSQWVCCLPPTYWLDINEISSIAIVEFAKTICGHNDS